MIIQNEYSYIATPVARTNRFRPDRDDASDKRHDDMLFHEKLDINLIRLVKENPVLYDHHNVKYMDFNTREVAWQKIGDELKRPAADCKVRWINIRDVYRRILKRNSDQGKRTKMYKYENEISFLRPYYKDVNIQQEEFESDDRSADEANDDCDDVHDDSSNDLLKPVKIKKEFNTSSVRKKKKKRESPEEPVDPISTSTFNESHINTPPAEFDSADPIDAFLLSIGATLKTFSPYHLNLAKSKIFAVVQEHDLQQIVQKRQNSEVTPHDIKVSTSESIYME